MSIELITLLMFASMMAFLPTGRQVFLIVGAVGTVAALALWGTGGAQMVYLGTFALVKWYIMLAFPPFIFMGFVLARSGVGDDLYEMMYKWFGHIKGGLGMGTIGICSLIAAMVGTSVSGTVTMGTIALPSMLKRKYDKQMVTGIIQAGGALGYLIPPSLIFILYGMLARESIGRLWIAGVVPGLILAGMYIAYIGIRCAHNPALGPPIPPGERFSWQEKFASIKAGILPIIIIFTVIGLLLMGVTTIIECSAIGAVGALICAAVHRRLTWKVFKDAMNESWRLVTIIVFLLTSALIFGAVYDGLGAIHVLENLIVNFAGSGKMVIVVMMLSWVFLGMVMDDTAMLIIVAPLYIPIVAHLGFDLVWFGVLYVITVEMALLTPPFGFSLFLMRGLVPKDSGITMTDIYRSVIPFVAIQGGMLALLLAFPEMCLWLPRLVFGG